MIRPILALGAILALALPALADDTALMEGAFGPVPVGGGITGKESVVQMVSEHLDFRFGRKFTDVVATFKFRSSLPIGEAKQLLGFPDFGAASAEAHRRDPKMKADWWDETNVQGPLTGMRTFVDGQPRTSALKFGFLKFDELNPRETPVPGARLQAWHTVLVTFPPGQVVTVQRRYRTGNGVNVLGQQSCDYVVYTGGNWHGPIEELVADVTLTDGLTTMDLAWDLPVERGASARHKDWKILSPTRLRTVWRHFEPKVEGPRGWLHLYTKPTVDQHGKPLKKR